MAPASPRPASPLGLGPDASCQVGPGAGRGGGGAEAAGCGEAKGAAVPRDRARGEWGLRTPRRLLRSPRCRRSGARADALMDAETARCSEALPQLQSLAVRC